VGQYPSSRVCHKFERSIAPTIVLGDKKGYAVYSPVEKKIDLAKKARRYKMKQEHNFISKIE